MATNNPQIRLQVNGTGVTSFDNTVSWVLDEKLEKSIKLNNSTESIDFSFIDIIQTMLFESDGDFTVSVTAGGATIDFEVTDMFMFSPSATFAATITDITVKETALVDRTINVRIYGVEATA